MLPAVPQDPDIATVALNHTHDHIYQKSPQNTRIPHHVLSVRASGHPGQDMEALGPSPHSHILSPRATRPSWQQWVNEASVDQGHICLRAGRQGDSCTSDNGDLYHAEMGYICKSLSGLSLSTHTPLATPEPEKIGQNTFTNEKLR